MMEEKRKRMNNIIVVNIPESRNDSAEERMKEDLTRVKSLIEKATDGKINTEEVSQPIRLGKLTIGSANKPRLLKVTVTSKETKQTIM